MRREAIRLSFDLEAVSEQLVDAQKSLGLWLAELAAVQAELAAVRAELAAVRAELAAARAELGAARDAAEAIAVEAADARTTARELQAALDAVRRTRTWRLHDRLARWSVFRWLARR